MKTLKKSLCLVLALVMVLSMGVISASADLDYEDVEDITYDEAVDVMSGIGVLEGYTDGTFLATKEVSRAEAAKIIAYLMVGDAKEADALKTTSDPFSDVSKNHWAAGYIAYLVQEGVIDGNGNGTFNPDGEVTGLAFGKMLLTALGYGVNDEYVGENWSINVAKDALQYGIYDGNLAGASSAAATREECALYAFNTLLLNKVTYSALLGGYIHNGDLFNAESNKADTFANDFDLTKAGAGDDAFYRPMGHVWKVGKKVITANYGADADLLGAYTTPVTGNELYTLIGRSTVNKLLSGKLEWNLYVDGAAIHEDVLKTEAEVDAISDLLAKGNTDVYDRTGYGIQTYVYENDNEVRVCIINTYLAQVSDVVEESKTKDAETTIAIGETGYDIVKTYETDEYAEDDYVLVTVSCKDNKDGKYEIQSMVPAVLVEAEITEYDSSKKYYNGHQITAGETTYTDATNDMVPGSEKPASEITKVYVDGDEYTLIIDEYGYLIAVTKDVAVTPTTYVYVAQFGIVETDNGLKTSNALKADVYYADGTNEIITLNKKSALEVLDSTAADILAATDEDQDAWVEAANDSLTGLYVLGSKNTIAKPAEVTSGDYYVIKRIARLYNLVDGAQTNTKGNWIANGKTTFFYVTGTYGDDLEVEVYTGYKAAPTCTGTQGITAGNGGTMGDRYALEAAVVTGEPEAKPVLTDDLYVWNGDYKKGTDKQTVYYYVTDLNGEDVTLTYTYKDEKAADTAIETNLAETKDSFFQAQDNGYFVVYTGKGYLDTVIEEVYDKTTIVVSDNDANAYTIEDAQLFDNAKAVKTNDSKTFVNANVKMIVDANDWTVVAVIFYDAPEAK